MSLKDLIVVLGKTRHILDIIKNLKRLVFSPKSFVEDKGLFERDLIEMVSFSFVCYFLIQFTLFDVFSIERSLRLFFIFILGCSLGALSPYLSWKIVGGKNLSLKRSFIIFSYYSIGLYVIYSFFSILLDGALTRYLPDLFEKIKIISKTGEPLVNLFKKSYLEGTLWRDFAILLFAKYFGLLICWGWILLGWGAYSKINFPRGNKVRSIAAFILNFLLINVIMVVFNIFRDGIVAQGT